MEPVRIRTAGTAITERNLPDESTSALMMRVYRNLRHGKTLPEALRAAMLQLAGRALMPAGEELDSWDAGRLRLHWRQYLRLVRVPVACCAACSAHDRCARARET